MPIKFLEVRIKIDLAVVVFHVLEADCQTH